jgi:uncharacterized membrane protein YeaQ/YmgE (transglycosylase-associated protein family)
MPNPITVMICATLAGWIAGGVFDYARPGSGEALLGVFACGFISTIIGAILLGAIRLKREG